MRKVFFIALIALNATVSNAQQEGVQIQGMNMRPDKPQVSSKVNKRYDDKGNLVSYDSTYCWSYSYKGDQLQHLTADSMTSAIRKLYRGFPLPNNGLDNAGRTDDFFLSPDYFMQSWQAHYFNMENLMRQIDSLRNVYLNKSCPASPKGVKQPSNEMVKGNII
jgi:hypothetical protein